MSFLNNFSVSVTKNLRGRYKEARDLCEAGLKMPRFISRRPARERPQLRLQRCLIVSKVTRYEYEKNSYKVSDAELERILRKRGSDYDALIATHREQKLFEQTVAGHLEAMGAEVKVASRFTYNDELLSWCDAVVPCGGDGTFLLAASRVRDANKPVIGFNSAPHKSVGRLCLPGRCSADVRGALRDLQEGRFSWMRRSRIRTTVTCDPQLVDSIAPVDLHTLHYTRYPGVSRPPEQDPGRIPGGTDSRDGRDGSDGSDGSDGADGSGTQLAKKVLPVLALNEVFIGESVTSRVSLLRLQIDRGVWTHTKSSGLCVTTGTGSTSWHFSINCLRTHSVQELIRTINESSGARLDDSVERARHLADRYNQKLMFDADSSKLAYSVREYITFEEWPVPRGLRVRDFAADVRVKSHCVDAGLVIDGSVSFPFNDGTEAFLEIHPDDALLTVNMDEGLHH